MVRNIIPFRAPDAASNPQVCDPEAKAFVDAVARAESGEDVRSDDRNKEIEAVWDALGQLEAADFGVSQAALPKPVLWQRREFIGGALLAASLVLGLGIMRGQKPALYETATGEQKTVHLSDGSQITLNTDTRLLARVSGKRREVRLESGEAFFTVAHRPDNAPFEVISGPARIRVTGTRFNVYRQAQATAVDLLEGGVTVGSETASSVTLRPGQAVQVDDAGQVGPVIAAQTSRILDWQQRRLSFDDTPLTDAVTEMNRYSRIKLKIPASKLRELKIDGVFDAGDTVGFARALQELHGVSVKKTEADIWLLET